MCNKFNQTQCQVFNPLGPKVFGMTKRPHFLTQMNESVFQQIGGVVDYNFGNKSGVHRSGWIFLFNIDGRPKFCATEENQTLSDDVRHERQLIPNYYSDPHFSANHLKI